MKLGLPHGVRLLQIDRAKLGELWEKLQDYCFYLQGGAYADPVYFTQDLMSDRTLVLETDYGIMIAREIRPGERAEVHLAMWDHKLSAHAEDLNMMLLWLFTTLQLRRVETYVYGFQSSVKRFLEKRMKFSREGRLRKRAVLREEFHDVDVYGILREEAFDVDA